MVYFFTCPFFEFEAIRILGESAHGGSEVGECLEAIKKISSRDGQSWNRAWGELANRAEQDAKTALSQGHRILAQKAFLRASNYSRAASYMLTGSARFPHPDALTAQLRTSRLFLQATQLFRHSPERLEIPFLGVNLPAFLYLPEPEQRFADGKTPVIINFNGADSIQEELFYMLPSEGPRHGYAVLTVDGPGQGVMRHKFALRMRPDWEVVGEAVIDYIIDYAQAYPDAHLDIDRIVVAGSSLGAYFALRAASDPRVRACLAIDPFYDLWDFVSVHIGQTAVGLWQSGYVSDAMVDRIIGAASLMTFRLKWEVSTMAQLFGLERPSDILREMQRYTLKTDGGVGSFLDRIRCPVLVSGATDSLYVKDLEQHALRVWKCLAKVPEEDKELWLPDEGAGSGSLQAKVGAFRLMSARCIAFLDRAFDVNREALAILPK